MVASLLALLVALPGDLDAAEQALAGGGAEEAIALLGDLADAPDAPLRALLLLARAQRAAGRPEMSVEPYLRAADRTPEDREIAREAAAACREAFEGSDAPDAGAYLEDARRMARRAEDPLLLGQILLLLRDHEEALVCFEKAGGSGDPGYLALQGRAECLLALGREADAKRAGAELFDAAVARRDLPVAYRTALAGGLGGRLLAWLDGLVAGSPADLRLRRYRGIARAHLLLYLEAAEDLRIVVEARADDLVARNTLSNALLQAWAQSREGALLDEAEGIAASTMREAGGRGGAEAESAASREQVRWLAQQRWVSSDLEGALRALRLLHDSDPGDSDAALNLGAIARRLGLHEEARRAYDAMLARDPDDPDALNDLGILVDGLGERARAVALWGRVLEVEPENLDALENLYTAAWEAGDVEGARGFADRGLRAAERRSRSVERWRWFRERLSWCPSAAAGQEANGR